MVVKFTTNLIKRHACGSLTHLRSRYGKYRLV